MNIKFIKSGCLHFDVKNKEERLGYLELCDDKIWKFGQEDEDGYLDEDDIRQVLYKLHELNSKLKAENEKTSELPG